MSEEYWFFGGGQRVAVAQMYNDRFAHLNFEIDLIDRFWETVPGLAVRKVKWLFDNRIEFSVRAIPDYILAENYFIEAARFVIVFRNPDHELLYRLTWGLEPDEIDFKRRVGEGDESEHGSGEDEPQPGSNADNDD